MLCCCKVYANCCSFQHRLSLLSVSSVEEYTARDCGLDGGLVLSLRNYSICYMYLRCVCVCVCVCVCMFVYIIYACMSDSVCVRVCLHNYFGCAYVCICAALVALFPVSTPQLFFLCTE